MHHLFTTQNLILAGVVVHLLFSAAKLAFKTPKQRAQIDQIEAKVDDVLNHVVQYLPADTAPTPGPSPVGTGEGRGGSLVAPISNSAQGGTS